MQAAFAVAQYGRHAPYAHVRPAAHCELVVQSDPSGPPPAEMQLTEPFVLFVTSHVWFAAQPHWGASPHALLGGTVVHEPGVPLLPDELPVPLLLPDEPLLVPDEPLLVPLEPPLLPPEELLDSSPPLLDSSPPLLDSSPPLLDSSSPLDERFGGTVTLSSSGSVG